MTHDTVAILPEVALTLGGALALALPRRGATVAFLTVLTASALLVLELRWSTLPLERLGGLLSVDPLTRITRALALALAAFAFVPLAAPSSSRDLRVPALLLFALAGFGVVAMAKNLLVFVVALEFVALPVTAHFALTLPRVRRSALLAVEAAGTGLVVFGLALLYLRVRSFDIARAGAMIVELTRERAHLPQLEFVSITLFVVGVLVKLGFPPLARARENSIDSSASDSFAALIPAGVGVLVLARLFDVLLSGRLVLGTSLDGPWPLGLGALGVLTLTVGLRAAFASTEAPRFFRALGFVHVGFALLALASLSRAGQAAAFLEVTSGLVLVLVAQRVLGAASAERPHDAQEDSTRGLGHQAPLVGGAVGLALVSSMSAPPTFGFVARLASFEALLEGAGPYRPFFVTLAAAVALAMLVQAVAIVRFVRVFFTDEALVAANATKTAKASAIVVFVFPLLLLGAFAAPIFNFVRACLAGME